MHRRVRQFPHDVLAVGERDGDGGGRTAGGVGDRLEVVKEAAEKKRRRLNDGVAVSGGGDIILGSFL